MVIHKFKLLVENSLSQMSTQDGEQVFDDISCDVSLLIEKMKVITFDNVFQGATALTKARLVKEDPQIS